MPHPAPATAMMDIIKAANPLIPTTGAHPAMRRQIHTMVSILAVDISGFRTYIVNL
jgi:hypothetical protein